MKRTARDHMSGCRRLLVLALATTGFACASLPEHAGAVEAGATVSVTVKLKAGITIAATASRLGFAATRPVLASRSIYQVDVVVTGREAKDPDAATQVINQLRKDSAFAYVEADDTSGPEDERFFAWIDGKADSVGTDPSPWLEQPALKMIGAAEAHQRTRGAGVIVAVLDTGADMTHPSLAGSFVGGFDYIDDDAQPADVGNGIDDDGDGLVDEAVGHGTFVSGIIAAVAPEAKLWVGRVLDSDGRGSAPVVAEALRDAVAAGATVVNMSFGMSTKLSSPALESAIRDAKDAGVVIVASAGNDASHNAFYPAATTGVMSVGAVRTDARQLTAFSNYGHWVDVAAPGERIVSTTPGGFSTWSGTSAAAPFVAGQAALLRSIDARDKADKIVEFIGSTARRFDKPFESTLLKGVIDLPASLAKIPSAVPDRPSTGTRVVVFDDALVAADDWGWARRNYASPSPVQSGSRAISVMADPWTGLLVHMKAPFTVIAGSTFEFWINPEAGGQQITVELFNSSTRKVLVPLGTMAANKWRRVQIDLRAFPPGDRVESIVFYAASPRAGGRYSLDNIAFIG